MIFHVVAFLWPGDPIRVEEPIDQAVGSSVVAPFAGNDVAPVLAPEE